MPYYRVYMFKRGHIQRAESMIAADDPEALLRAETLHKGEPFELWCGARLVKAQDEGPDASAALPIRA